MPQIIDRDSFRADRMTAEEVKDYLGETSVEAVWRRCRLRQIPHFRIGRTVRFSRSALEKWIAAQEGTAPQPQSAA